MEVQRGFLENDLQDMRYPVMITTELAWGRLGDLGVLSAESNQLRPQMERRLRCLAMCPSP